MDLYLISVSLFLTVGSLLFAFTLGNSSSVLSASNSAIIFKTPAPIIANISNNNPISIIPTVIPETTLVPTNTPLPNNIYTSPTSKPRSTSSPNPISKPGPITNPLPTSSFIPNPIKSAIKISAWLYPGPPACNAVIEYQTRTINNLNMEYLRVNTSGGLTTLTEANTGCNGYSDVNALSVKKYSNEQYVTVSADYSDFSKMIRNIALRNAFINNATNFVEFIGFTGLDIDFEGFDQWTDADYTAYKATIKSLGNALHAKGKKLQIDLPAISDLNTQSYIKLKYEDLNNLPIDQYTIMAYDYQFDHGAGKAIQPISWLNSVIDWAKLKFTNTDKISIGIPAYGYQGACNTYNFTLLTYDQIKTKPGFSTATREGDSQEMKWTNAGNCYFYSDTTSLNAKLDAVRNKGLKQVSVWHLGGNQWFSR